MCLGLRHVLIYGEIELLRYSNGVRIEYGLPCEMIHHGWGEADAENLWDFVHGLAFDADTFSPADSTVLVV